MIVKEREVFAPLRTRRMEEWLSVQGCKKEVVVIEALFAGVQTSPCDSKTREHFYTGDVLVVKSKNNQSRIITAGLDVIPFSETASYRLF